MLTRDELDKLQTLARLRLSEEEVPLFLEQLGRILGYVEMLEGLELEGVAPLAHPGSRATPVRQDEPGPSTSRGEALAQAPETDGALVLVPRILKGREP